MNVKQLIANRQTADMVPVDLTIWDAMWECVENNWHNDNLADEAIARDYRLLDMLRAGDFFDRELDRDIGFWREMLSWTDNSHVEFSLNNSELASVFECMCTVMIQHLDTPSFIN